MPESGNVLSNKHEGAVEMEAFTGRVGQEKEVSSKEWIVSGEVTCLWWMEGVCPEDYLLSK